MSDETLTSSPPSSPSADQRTRTIAAAVAVGAAALFLLVAIAVTRGSGDSGAAAETTGDDSGLAGVAVDPGRPRPSFTLTDTEGQPYDFATETQGKLTMLFFGYTNCPDICPVQMATLTAALDEPGMPEATVVFVTTDPERDTPDRLRDWLGGFDGDYVGLIGTPEQVAQAELAAGIPNSVIFDGVSGEYEVGHAAQVLAYSPDDVAHVEYPSGVRREDWIADLPLLVERRG